MSGYNCLNYTEQGGAVTHIGGKLVIENGASVEGLPVADNVPASEATTAAGAVTDLNKVIKALKDAGLMEADAD